jgi:hypothetical protein
VKRRSLRRPARWQASCAACVSSILEVGAAGTEEEAAESCRDRLKDAIAERVLQGFEEEGPTTSPVHLGSVHRALEHPEAATPPLTRLLGTGSSKLSAPGLAE